jgi:hypothetical protein
MPAMKRLWKNVGISAFIVGFASVVGSACAHNDATIFIRQVLEPAVPTGTLCTYTADVTQASESTGIVDVSFPLTSYTPEVLVGNQIVSQGNMNALQAETSRVFINGAITRITDLAGDTSLIQMFSDMCTNGDKAACATGKALEKTPSLQPINPFSTVESTSIDPASGSTATYSTLALTMIDGATINVMKMYFENVYAISPATAFSSSVQLITYTKAEGKTQGGDTVESNEFEFPVTFVYGGLVSNLSNVDGTYCVLLSSTMSSMAMTCISGQDSAVELGAFPDPNVSPPINTCGAAIPVGDAG